MNASDLSLAPGFSRVSSPAARGNRFNGFPVARREFAREAVETAFARRCLNTGLKPGANKLAESPNSLRNIRPCAASVLMR
jgi:hypothetical protein